MKTLQDEVKIKLERQVVEIKKSLANEFEIQDRKASAARNSELV